MTASRKLKEDRAMFAMLHGKLAYRCPVCDTCRSAEVDTPCSAYCAGLAKKSTRRRRRAEGGGAS